MVTVDSCLILWFVFINKIKMKKAGKILIVILCLIILGILFYFSLKIYQEKSKNIINTNQKYLDLNKENVLNSDIYNREGEVETVDDNLRKEFIDYTENNINQLTPFLSNNDPEWTINKFSFVNNSNFYVEYNDDHALGRILVYCVKSSETVNCSRIADFTPNNFIWELNEGNDPFIDRPLQYYEKNKDGEWQKTFKSTEIFYFPVSKDTMQGMQQSIDNGNDLWRLDPIETTNHDIANMFRYDLEDIKSVIVSKNNSEVYMKVNHLNSEYKVYLRQPVKEGEGGIWIIQYLKFVK